MTIKHAGGVEEVYSKCVARIEAIIRRMKCPAPLALEDLRAEAGLLFMQAWHGYDPSKGTAFTTWMEYTIRNGLLSQLRQQLERGRILHRREFTKDNCHTAVQIPGHWSQGVRSLIDLLPQPRASTFCLEEFLGKLSDDALDAVALAGKTWAEGMLGSEARRIVREGLKGMGWAAGRIREAFSEIQFALETR